MKILVDQRTFRLPEGINDVLDRAAQELRIKPSDYCRSAILEKLRSDGFLDTGKRLHASLIALGRGAR